MSGLSQRPRALRSAPVVVAVVIAAPLRATGVSEVWAEQRFGEPSGSCRNLRSPGLYFLPSLHTLQGTSFHMPPSPLLSYRWLEGTHLSALRDMPMFLD